MTPIELAERKDGESIILRKVGNYLQLGKT
jgi:hypothetical protein